MKEKTSTYQNVNYLFQMQTWPIRYALVESFRIYASIEHAMIGKQEFELRSNDCLNVRDFAPAPTPDPIQQDTVDQTIKLMCVSWHKS